MNREPTAAGKVFQRAAECLGGRALLARRLNVQRDELDAWIDRQATAPGDVLVEAIDLILRYEPCPR
jgi:hypothetical protein